MKVFRIEFDLLRKRSNDIGWSLSPSALGPSVLLAVNLSLGNTVTRAPEEYSFPLCLFPKPSLSGSKLSTVQKTHAP